MPELTQVHPGIWRLRLGTPEAITPAAVRESAVAVAALGRLPAVGAPPFAAAAIDCRESARGLTLTLPLGADEGIFGFGLQLKSVLQNGKKKTVRINSDPIGDTGDSHAPVPLYLSTAGYGVLVDTCRYASFYVGSHAEPERLADRANSKHAAAPGDLDALYRRRTVGRRVVVDLPTARGVDLYLFGGPTLGQALQRYNLFSGGGCLPPLWGLGVWYRAYGGFSQDEVASLARTIRDGKMPCDVLGLEPGWHDRCYPNTFTWSPERYPRPDDLLAEMSRLGLRVNLWENAFVHPETPLARALAPHCADEPSTDGLAPDFLIPAAREAFAAHHDRELVARGISGFKLDECDNSDYTGAWSFPEHSRFPSGADGEQMHSLLGVLYQRVIDSVFRARGRRHYSEVRSSHALAAPLPFVLYSDLYEHRDFVRGLVTASFGGLLWCPEVRDAQSVEDLVRRIQAVALSPQALVNAWYIRNPPWFQVRTEANNRGEAMPEQELATRLVRAAFELRMRLLPVFYAAFARYRDEGVPPVRALALDFPDEPATWEIADQFLIGDALLAAPVFAGQASRTVYLPRGHWRDFVTGAPIEGGRTIEAPAALETIPLFVREGSILPLADPVECIRPETVLAITPTVYATDAAQGVLFDDDGESYAFERGEATRVALHWTRKAGLTLTPAEPSLLRHRIGAVRIIG